MRLCLNRGASYFLAEAAKPRQHEMVVSWHDMTISWLDMMVSCHNMMNPIHFIDPYFRLDRDREFGKEFVWEKDKK